jgi:hypothetical protein
LTERTLTKICAIHHRYAVPAEGQPHAREGQVNGKDIGEVLIAAPVAPVFDAASARRGAGAQEPDARRIVAQPR